MSEAGGMSKENATLVRNVVEKCKSPEVADPYVYANIFLLSLVNSLVEK